MVVLFNISIKTIRGEEFNAEIDRDADTLGLKVQIWEQRNIPVESQRLVFAGRELQDATKLTDAGVGEGATIFMVEAAGQEVAPPAFSQPAPQNPVVAADPVVVANRLPLVQQDADRVVVNLQHPINAGGRQIVGYEPLAPEILAQERKDATVDLAAWVRKYTLFTAFLMIVAAALLPCGGFMLLPIFLTLVGWMGTRNLCRCCLGIYAIAILIGAMSLIGHGVGFLTWGTQHHKKYSWAFSLLIFVGILHLCIFMCIVKLMRNVRALSADEKKEVKTRIQTHRTLC